jgi:two-component system phosphate regulon sensor histidine kinase PhoR
MKYDFAPLDINSIVQKAFDIMQYQFERGGFTCSVTLCEQPVTVQADEDRLLEAITNLLSNAMKYSAEDKNINIRVSCSDQYVNVEIEDFGLGISASDLPHLYEPFYRSQTGDVQKRGGVGLGLALVKHIVDAHSGHIQVSSLPARGSTFTISLHR